MENRKWRPLSLTALIVSLLPLTTLVPVMLRLTLPQGVNTIWAGANVASAVVGLILAIVCVKNRESRSPVNLAAAIISAFWCLLMTGIVALAAVLSFLQ